MVFYIIFSDKASIGKTIIHLMIGSIFFVYATGGQKILDKIPLLQKNSKK